VVIFLWGEGVPPFVHPWVLFNVNAVKHSFFHLMKYRRHADGSEDLPLEHEEPGKEVHLSWFPQILVLEYQEKDCPLFFRDAGLLHAAEGVLRDTLSLEKDLLFWNLHARSLLLLILKRTFLFLFQFPLPSGKGKEKGEGERNGPDKEQSDKSLRITRF